MFQITKQIKVKILVLQGRCRKLIDTFSANDLRRCDLDTLKSRLGKTALSFTEEVVSRSCENKETGRRELVTCQAETPLSEVIQKAVTKHVHRVWEVDQEGLLLGIVSLSDIFKIIRASLMADFQADPSRMWSINMVHYSLPCPWSCVLYYLLHPHIGGNHVFKSLYMGNWLVSVLKSSIFNISRSIGTRAIWNVIH